MSRSDGDFELLVFDWDGTLLDSIASIVECAQATLQELGLERADDRVVRDTIGLGLRETVERLAPGCGSQMFRRIVEVYRRLWVEEYSHHPRLFPRTEEILGNLQRRGLRLAVATAKSRRGLDRDLLATGLGHWFDATRTVDEARSKPHPQMILDILSELGVGASATLVVGDTTHDVEMAHNAGARAVAVCTGSHGREGLESASPLACLEDLGELVAWLDDARSTAGRG